ncbi:2-octaprenyl-6-methoxyphenyl hydroxylase [Congregibacter variabilis]|uniref:2-octaprenyl-6-methoxyphenyl hydroxylase n=1 Tax=Congregibacter variabilis TaxID=3081200 RepID=A0ABZ0HZM9_9GAMM|nr:2-octaprenyl-6-methoxyphenyl hydroxylase [Congregibacter sp. IMCC43200]
MSVQAPHILIAGGGMVGLSLALLLHEQLPDSARITLVEGRALPAPGDVQAGYHPSFDARSTALSYSTATLYRELGLWSSLLPGLAPIDQIHVSRRGRFGSSLLSSAEQGWDALGWVVENPCLGRTLLAAAHDCSRLTLRCPDRVTDAKPQGLGMRVILDQEEIDADVLVIADGAESTLREKLGFLTQRKTYGQSALIANLAFEKDHGGVAYERFTATGPLALLPLPPSQQAPHRMALVWTLAPAEAAALEIAELEVFSRTLIDAFGYRLGRVLRVGERHSYPLTLTEAVEQVRRGCVVLGNAAHALHPVAGQGFNLALRDAAALSRTFAEAVHKDTGVGDTAVLAAYAQDRQRDQAQTIAASDGLPALFMVTDPVLSLGRDLALSGMDMFPLLRREFVQQAAGMAALESGHG